MTTGVGERLAAVLAAGGIKAIFGVPGGQTLPLYGAVGEAGVRHVLMRDERNAACAADAYSRVARRAGFCDATVGPGVTNLVSGLAEAHSSSIPMVAIIADIRTTTGHLRTRGVVSQAIEQRALLAPITKWVGRVERAEALDDILDQALRIATTGRPGPVCVEIPEDVFQESMPGPRREFGPDSFSYPRFRPAPAAETVEAAARLLAQAKRPLILAGGGVPISGAEQVVAGLVDEHQIPIVTSISGKGTIDEYSPLAAGVTGVFGTRRANAAMLAADVIVAIGAKLSQLTTHSWRVPSGDQQLIHVDVDGEEIGRTFPATVGICCDAREGAEALMVALRSVTRERRNWLEDLEPAGPGESARDAVEPRELAAVLDGALQPGDVLLCDASLASGWGAAHFRVKRSGRGFLAPRGLAGIGWAGGASMGARMALEGDRKLVSLAGDGAWGYSLSEVETAVRTNADITYVVLNNASLAWVAHGQKRLGIPQSTFGPVDFAAIARAMGAEGARVNNLEDFSQQLHHSLEHIGPSLIEVDSSAESSPIVSLKDVPKGTYF